MINFTSAFDSAWERMMVILFRPFDLGKWCTIGFSAFLAGLLQGGNGVNGGSFNNFNDLYQRHFNPGASQTPQFDLHQLNTTFTQLFSGAAAALFIMIFIVALAVGLAMALVIYWLGARGQFLFLDNIVRNRGAISWPWSAYARHANSLFGFYVLVLAISFLIFIPILIVAGVMCIPLIQHHRWPEGGEIAGFVILGLIYFLVALVLGFLLFVFREFGVPLMFRRGLLARAAFWESMDLIRRHPGSVVLFVLLRIAIFIGVAVIAIIVCCGTCGCGMLPYIGTVFLLPVLVYVRCFTLDCLAQFGPEYNVWTVDVPPPAETPAAPPFVNPPPPPG